MGDDLEERLKSHAKAFEGLMSLIPAKEYYGQDTSDQWQRKKQTKEEKRNAKRAQLDPQNLKSAQDIMDEKERKRKRAMEGVDEHSSNPLSSDRAEIGDGPETIAKKQKLDGSSIVAPEHAVNTDDESQTRNKQEKRKEKAQRRKEKQAKMREKAEAKKANRQGKLTEEEDMEHELDYSGPEISQALEREKDHFVNAVPVERLDVSGLVDDQQDQSRSTATPSTPRSPDSTGSMNPSASSTSSIPPTTPKDNDKPRKIPKLPEAQHEVLKARLTARIEALRAARKADGIDGKPARTRQELLEARRRKEEQRKAHKKELRAKAKEEEQRKAAEAELARLRGSGSPNTPDIFSPSGETNSFSFGRIMFDDGQQLDPSMSSFLDHQSRGPSDPKTALEAAQKKRAKLNDLDVEKKADIEEKDMWLNAKKRAHHEKVRDDVSLLKKTLKRKQKAKQKSEREWNDRIEGVQKGKEVRQRKREDNIKKRKDEKGVKGKSKSKGKPAGKKSKSRPGFEGSFRAKAK